MLFFFFIGWYSWNHLEDFIGIPKEFRMIQGRVQSYTTKWPLQVEIAPEAQGILQIQSGKKLTINPLQAGESTFDLSLFGFIPLKNRVVSVVPELKVVPSGESIGVMLAAQGLIVAQLAKVRMPDGTYLSPAAEAGLLPGDLLVQINQHVVSNPLDVEEALRYYRGNSVTVKVVRGGEPHFFQVQPATIIDSNGNKELRLGIYLEDTAAGVGTLTFYHPDTRKYAALGHMITDTRTGQEALITDGKIVAAIIAGVRPGIKGRPGEKIGLFQDRAPSLGNIGKNSPIGIYGELQRLPHYQQEPLPVALVHEVEVGPAQILTVVEHDQVEVFDIEIIKINKQSKPSAKGMVIEITDPKLLQITGGIVQGMSGSPIIQHGKVVGAITHVFVNDPTRGYAVFAEWMAHEGGLFEQTLPSRGDAAA